MHKLIVAQPPIGSGSYSNVYAIVRYDPIFHTSSTALARIPADEKKRRKSQVLKICEVLQMENKYKDHFTEAAALTDLRGMSPYIVQLHGTCMVLPNPSTGPALRSRIFRWKQRRRQRRTPQRVPGLILERLDGPLLQEFLNDTPLPPLEFVLEWMYQLLSALQACHEHGWVHADVHTANCCLDYRNPCTSNHVHVKIEEEATTDYYRHKRCAAPRLKLIDFNLAQPIGTKVMRTLTSPFFRAPERIFNSLLPCDPAMDIWSAGCVLASILLGGQQVFDPRRSVSYVEPPTAAAAKNDSSHVEEKKAATKYTTLDILVGIFSRVGYPTPDALRALLGDVQQAAAELINACGPPLKMEEDEKKREQAIDASMKRLLDTQLQKPEMLDKISRLAFAQSTPGRSKLYLQLVDLLKQCWAYDPKCRPSAKQALEHACFKSYCPCSIVVSVPFSSSASKPFSESLDIDWVTPYRRFYRHRQHQQKNGMNPLPRTA